MASYYTITFSICENNKQIVHRNAEVSPEQFTIMTSMPIGSTIDLTDSVNVPAERRQELSSLCGVYRIIDTQRSVKVETILSSYATCKHCIIKLTRI